MENELENELDNKDDNNVDKQYIKTVSYTHLPCLLFRQKAVFKSRNPNKDHCNGLLVDFGTSVEI